VRARGEVAQPGTIPGRAGEIDADWLTEALSSRYPEARVANVEVVERTQATNAHARLQVRYRESGGAPESFFCKLLPSDEPRRQAIAATWMGVREALFYERLAPALELRVPRAYVVRYDESDGEFVLLVEDLADTGCTISDGTVGVNRDSAARALEDLAGMHVRFEDVATRRAEASWVPEPDPPSDYGSLRLQEALDHHRARLTPAFAEMAELYIAQQRALHELWHEGPKTVIHGDAHLGNLFDDRGRTGFLDWGIIGLSTPLRDMSYFLNLSLSIEDRRAEERHLIRHYLDVRKALGGTPFSFDRAWRDHRLQASYLAPACCQIVTFPEDITAARRTFSEAFLARAEAALEDLETRDALRRYAGL
jgi:aminoglycoside phosphotransferase (APT) family kinase protein